MLAMLCLRSFSCLCNGHCCVYSIGHQLGLPNYDTNAPAFNLSDADCLRLRTEAHGLLSKAGAFLNRCLVPFTGTTELCCSVPHCRVRRSRSENPPVATNADGLPLEWVDTVTGPLLRMGSSVDGPGYVGDTFIRAMAITYQRDIVVLSTRPCQGFDIPGAIFSTQTKRGSEPNARSVGTLQPSATVPCTTFYRLGRFLRLHSSPQASPATT